MTALAVCGFYALIGILVGLLVIGTIDKIIQRW